MPFSVAMLGIATYSTMDVLMKGLSIELGEYNAMLWRTAVALLLSGSFLAMKFQRWPERPVLRLHLWRGVITAIMAFLFFWGLIHVPLAEAIGLSFIAPLIALYLAAVLLKEKIGRQAFDAKYSTAKVKAYGQRTDAQIRSLEEQDVSNSTTNLAASTSKEAFPKVYEGSGKRLLVGYQMFPVGRRDWPLEGHQIQLTARKCRRNETRKERRLTVLNYLFKQACY